jgi:hypothetical protein
MEPTMEEKQTTPSSVGLKYGLITGAVLIIYTLIILMAGQFQNRWLGVFSYLILIGMIVFAHRTFKEENTGFMSYGQGLGIGSILSLVSGTLNGIFVFIYIRLIDDSFLRNTLEEARYTLEEQGMDSSDIDQAMSWTEMLLPIGMVVGTAIGTLIMGFIFSLIISAFTKNENPEFH